MRDRKWRQQNWSRLSRESDWRRYIAYGDAQTYYESGKAEAKRLERFYGADDSVLEVNCGDGRILRFISGRARLSVGIDICPEFLERYQGLAACSDAASLPFADGAFDFVYSINSMLHLDDDEHARAVKEAARVSRRAVFFLFPSKEAGFYKSTGWVNPVSRERVDELGRMTGKPYGVSPARLMLYSDGASVEREWQLLIESKEIGVESEADRLHQGSQ